MLEKEIIKDEKYLPNTLDSLNTKDIDISRGKK